MIHPRESSQAAEFRPISLRRALQPFFGRRRALLLAALLPAAVVGVGSGLLPPSYRATSQVLLEQEQVQLGKIADVMKATVLPDSASISNEIAIMLSTPVLEGAARRLGLLGDDGLTGANPPWQAARGFLRTYGLLRTGPEQSATRITDVMRASLKVTRSLNALVVDVEASAADAVTAAAIANAVVDEYLARQGREKREVADRALGWMNGEIGDLRRRIAELNRRAELERRAMLGAEAADPATTEDQLRTVGSALAVARTDRADAAARLSELRAALKRIGAGAVGELITSPELSVARRQLADLEQKLAGETASRSSRRPIVAELRAQIAAQTAFAQGLIKQELERLDLDARIKSERVEGLLRESRALQLEALSLEQAHVAIADIEREAAAHQELYVVLLTRLNEIAAQKEAIVPDARVLNAAVPPEAPAAPRRALLAALAGVLGVAGFTGFVLAADALSSRFESLGDLEEATGLTVLGAVSRREPAMQSRRVVDRDIGILPAEDGVEIAIMLRGTGPLPRIVVLVPAAAVADAEALALRVVASADRHDRSIRVISLEADPGARPEGALFEMMPLAMHMAVEQDGGARAAAQIRQSSAHCDAVLLILPPVAETALIAAWARLADSSIVVVDGRRPERALVLRTVSRLRDAGVLPAGVVAVAS